MNDLAAVVDWSRWQFALTAIYHWLFVPLTLGLSMMVAVMETVWFKKRTDKWLKMTKFWMTLFGINFAVGVATGIILEFEFGTNWSNYSWFVGDIFGAPLAIEGLFAFFLESTFVAVMFFGWKKVSAGFHLTSTWLTAIGASISALWILVANAWMQYPAGMEFDPAQMRNVMVNFVDLFSPIAINKFFHAVLSAWVLAGVFVIGVSCWFLLKRRNIEFAITSIKVGGWFGLIGMVLTLWTGDGSAVQVARYQPMKLAAMEGLYNGSVGQGIVAFGVLSPEEERTKGDDPLSFGITIPKGLSILANHDANSFVPGINDLVAGVSINENGDTINTVSYAERIARGKASHEALRAYDRAYINADKAAVDSALQALKADYQYFGYGYLDKPEDAIPPVDLTFYMFHVMVILGGYFLVFFIVFIVLAYKSEILQKSKLMQWVAMLSIPLVWLCSEAGWVVAEVGRQPWTIQDLLPTSAAVSEISASSVIVTFWLFAVVFTLLLAAEVSIMLRQISRASKENLD